MYTRYLVYYAAATLDILYTTPLPLSNSGLRYTRCWTLAHTCRNPRTLPDTPNITRRYMSEPWSLEHESCNSHLVMQY